MTRPVALPALTISRPSEGVATVVEIGGGDALRAWELHSGGEQAGALHADADDAEAQAITGGNCGIAGGFEARVSQEKCVGGGEGAGGSGSALQEFAAREIFFHLTLLMRKNGHRKSKIKIEEKCQAWKPGL